MATFRELRDKLNGLNDEQLDQEIKIITKGYSVNEPLIESYNNGIMETKLDLCIAEFDLWYTTDSYNAGVPDIPLEDEDYILEDVDEDDNPDIVMLGVNKGMPYFSLHDEVWWNDDGFIIN